MTSTICRRGVPCARSHCKLRKWPTERPSWLRIMLGQLTICFFFIVFFFLGSSSVSQAHSTAGSGLDYPGVWRIQNQQRNVKATAFAVESDKFITAAHVLKDFLDKNTKKMFLWKGNKAILVTRILRISTTYDLALVQTEEEVNHHIHLSDEFNRNSIEHYAVGYPGGEFRAIEQTVKVTFENDASYLFAMNWGGLVGMSGSPVLNERGEFVSVAHSAIDNMVFGVKGEIIALFIDGQDSVGVTCSQPHSLQKCFKQAVKKTRDMAENLEDRVAQFQLGRPRGYINGHYIGRCPQNPSPASGRAWRTYHRHRGREHASQIVDRLPLQVADVDFLLHICLGRLVGRLHNLHTVRRPLASFSHISLPCSQQRPR